MESEYGVWGAELEIVKRIKNEVTHWGHDNSDWELLEKYFFAKFNEEKKTDPVVLQQREGFLVFE